MTRKPAERVGPEPLPEHLYAARQLPVRKAVFWSGRVLILLIGVGVLLGIFIMALYRIPSGEPVLRSLSAVLPVPVARVNGTSIKYRAYNDMVDGWTELYGQQGAQGEAGAGLVKERILARMIQDILLVELVQEMDVTISENDIATVEETFLEQYENEARYAEALYRQFKWSPEQFRTFVVEPLARLRILDVAVLGWAQAQEQPRSAITDLHRDVTEDSDRFAELATQVSASLSAADGGELGLRPISDYPEVVRTDLLNTEEAEITGLIELTDRFVFYKILEQSTIRRERHVNVQEISVGKRNIYDVLKERHSNADIVYYVSR